MARRDDARRRGDAFADRAAAAGDRIAELCGRLQAAVDGERPNETVPPLVREALPVFERANDDLALFVAHNARLGTDVGWDVVLEILEVAERHARRAGYEPAEYPGWHAAARCFGSTPAPELLAWLDANEPPTGRDHYLRAYRANGVVMLGRFDEARVILAGTRQELRERGAGVLLANILSYESYWLEMRAGEPAAALEYVTQGWEVYQQLGERGWLHGTATRLAEAHLALDQLEGGPGPPGRQSSRPISR